MKMEFLGLTSVLRPATRWRLQTARCALKETGLHSVPSPKICNLCNRESFFKPFGWPMRPEACCPYCGSLERHRLLKLWLDQNRTKLDGKQLLHFAPEGIVSDLMRAMLGRYVTADISPGYDLQIDIENTALPGESFDFVLCCHVLEHVPDVHAALAELHRIIAVGGSALLMVPIVEGWSKTYEDSTITKPSEREQHFGQSDHLRYFGSDFRDFVSGAGFDLQEFTSEGPDVVRYGLYRGEKVFIATRPTI
jgi:SAM-dependent methyltransferase